MLFQHQRDGAQWLAQRTHAYLGDLPGTGKTRTLLHALDLIGAQAPLVFCPAIVRSHWRRESQLVRGRDIRVRSYDEAVLGHYGLMREMILQEHADVLILDEAHYLKHATALRTQILLGPNGYAKRIPVVWCASGTPIPRHPGEFWTVLSSLFPAEALKHGCRTRADFEAKFCITKGRLVRGLWREKVVGMRNEIEFQRLLTDILLRREPSDDVPKTWWQPLVLDAPDFVDNDGFVYPAHLREMRQWDGFLADLADTPHIARYRRRVGEAKVKPVVEMLAHELQSSDEKIVLFAHHTSVLDALAKALKTFGVVQIDGRTTPARREEKLRLFQTNPACRVFIGQNQACGTGFDGLQQVANRMLVLEPSWVAAENAQLGARLARKGQTRWPVRAQMVTLAGTLDEWIVGQNLREVELQHRMFPEQVAL